MASLGAARDRIERLMVDYCFVEKRLPGPSGFSDDAFVMFHGWARRDGAAYPLLEYRYGDQLAHPLKVTKNVHGIADIFQPNQSWIVSERAKGRLADSPHIDFLPVEFSKVFDAPYELGEEMFPDLEDDEILEQFAHDQRLLDSLGRWYEVVIPNYDQSPAIVARVRNTR